MADGPSGSLSYFGKELILNSAKIGAEEPKQGSSLYSRWQGVKP